MAFMRGNYKSCYYLADHLVSQPMLFYLKISDSNLSDKPLGLSFCQLLFHLGFVFK